MNGIYTPSGGSSPESLALNNLISAMQAAGPVLSNPQSAASVNGPQAVQAGTDINQAVAGMQGNVGTAQANANSQMFNQSGIPQMQGQQQDIGKIFQMYLADKNLASQYMNNVNPNIYENSAVMQSSANNPLNNLPGFASSAPNPYLASAGDIINSVLPTPGSNFGFSDPQSAIAASSVPLSSATHLINLLQGAIGNQQQLVNQGMNTYSQNYAGTMGNLGNFANSLLNLGYYSGGNAANVPGTKQNAGSVYQTLKDTFAGNQAASGRPATWDGFYYYLKSQKNALAAQGVDTHELFNLQGMDRQEFGGDGEVNSGGKISTGAAKQALAVNNGIAAVKNFGSIISNYQSGFQDAKFLGQDIKVPFLGDIMLPKNADSQKKYGAQRDLYLSNVAKLLGVSRSNVAFQRLAGNLPGNNIGIGAEGGFRGHLATLLDTAQLVLVKDNRTGKYGVTPMTAFDSNTETQIDPLDNSIPFNTLQKIIGGL